MSDRDPTNVPEGDLPWNDEPADPDVVPGTEEPDPAEVEGDEGEEVDVSHSRIPDISDKYRRETLDQRLSEEVPDRPLHAQDPVARGLQAAITGEDDDLELGRAEPGGADEHDADGDEPAEEAAIHIVDEDRI